MTNESPKNNSLIYKYPPCYSSAVSTQVTLKVAFKLLSHRVIKKELN